MYIHAFVEGDETESLSSITAAMDATLPSLPRRTRLAVVGMGGINARGPGSTGRVHRADNGLPYTDPGSPGDGGAGVRGRWWPMRSRWQGLQHLQRRGKRGVDLVVCRRAVASCNDDGLQSG